MNTYEVPRRATYGLIQSGYLNRVSERYWTCVTSGYESQNSNCYTGCQMNVKELIDLHA